MEYSNPWYYKGEPVLELPEKVVGFVYLITNRLDDTKYIGKKSATRTKVRQVNKKKRRTKVESDWRDYYSSSEELKALVEKHGGENFSREIIQWCYSKAEASYYETKFIFEHDALLRDDYLNLWVSARVRKAHLKSIKIPK